MHAINYDASAEFRRQLSRSVNTELVRLLQSLLVLETLPIMSDWRVSELYYNGFVFVRCHSCVENTLMYSHTKIPLDIFHSLDENVPIISSSLRCPQVHKG